MVMRNINGRWATPYGVPAPMTVFDDLPPEIRALIRNSPYDIAIGTVVENINRFGTELTIGWLRTGIPIVMKSSTILTYGPDHPQAGA